MEQQVELQSNEDKTVAIVSYLGLLGWIIALVIHQNNKTQLGAYHLRQMLGLMIAGVLAIIPIIGWIWGIFLLVAWIIGLISAIQGQKKPLILIGKLFEGWFANLFN